MNNTNLIINAFFWFFGFLLLWEIKYCENNVDVNKITKKSISIIIPARNEERNLPDLDNIKFCAYFS